MYTPNKSELAYDLSLFDVEEREKEKEQEQQKKQIKIVTTSASKSGSVIKSCAILAFCGALAFAFLYSKVQLSELTTEINDENAVLDEALSENARLQSNLDNMVTLTKVEEYASTILGMEKIQTGQTEYISVDTEDMVEIAQDEDNVFLSIKDWFDGVVEYLGF